MTNLPIRLTIAAHQLRLQAERTIGPVSDDMVRWAELMEETAKSIVPDMLDADRFRWLKRHVVFLHQAYGERDPVDGCRPEWNIEGDWTNGETNGRWYPSLEDAIDKERSGDTQT